MLTEDQLNKLPEAIVQQLRSINDDYLELIGQTIKECSEIKPTDIHRIQQMKQTGTSLSDIETKLARVAGKSEDYIHNMLETIARDNLKFSEKVMGDDYIPYEDNIYLQRIVDSLASQMASDFRNYTANTAFMVFNESGTKVSTTLHEAYSNVLDRATQTIVSGHSDFYSQMRSCCRQVADMGIRTKYSPLNGSAGPAVDYATKYSRRLDTAVRQNLLWGMKQCNLGVQEEVGKQFGANGYEIDYHSHPRPTHAEMGGRQYICEDHGRTINGVYFAPFSEVESLLNDYGCLHFKWPIICGVSVPTHDEDELKQLKAKDKERYEVDGKHYTRYELSQIQRKIETSIRHAKDRQKIAKAAGDDELRRMEQAKINVLKSKYEKVSEAADLPVKKERMSVSGYHRVKTKSD